MTRAHRLSRLPALLLLCGSMAAHVALAQGVPPLPSGVTPGAGAMAPQHGMLGTAAVAAAPAGASDAYVDDTAAAALRAQFAARQQVLDERTAKMNLAYQIAQHDCYSKFLVNYCLDQARSRMLATKAATRTDQLALSAEERQLNAQQRDQRAALQRAQDAAQAPQRAANEQNNQAAYQEKQRQHAIGQAQRAANAPQRQANQNAYDQKQADFQQRLDNAHAQAAQAAQQRAENVERYNAKQQAAAQHAQDVEARRERAAQRNQGASASAGSTLPPLLAPDTPARPASAVPAAPSSAPAQRVQ